MASILTSTLAAVPWAKVITLAPAILDSAERLWSRIRKKDSLSAKNSKDLLVSHEGKLQSLDTRIVELESEVADSSAILKSLAEQNSRLIAEVEVLRRHALAQFVAIAVLAIAVSGVYIWLLLR